MATPSIVIDDRPIGPNHPPYIVAEVSANHNGDIERAFKILAAAKEAGADAVKLQTYTADTMTIDHDGDDFQIREGLWRGYKLYDLYKWAETPFEWQERLFARGRDLGITVFSTPFDASAVDLLETCNSPAYKIASFEAVDLPLIEHTARTNKPLIISTGLADLGEIGDAVSTARNSGSGGIVLLHCVSAYPAPVEQTNLRTIPHLAQAFDVVAGLSDHTLGIAVSVAAVALGACLIEKHFTLSRADEGPDSEFSLEPNELADLVSSSRKAWAALGNVHYERERCEDRNVIFRRSLYAVKHIAKGERFTRDNVRSIRPGYGLKPKYFDDITGRIATSDVDRGTPLTWDLVGGD